VAIDYREQAECLVRARERSDNDGGGAQDAFLTDVLRDSAGAAPNGDTYFRPYYTAAFALSVQTYRVEKAPEADFRATEAQIQALLAHQAALDRKFSLTVPPGMEADTTNMLSGAKQRFSTVAMVEGRF